MSEKDTPIKVFIHVKGNKVCSLTPIAPQDFPCPKVNLRQGSLQPHQSHSVAYLHQGKLNSEGLGEKLLNKGTDSMMLVYTVMNNNTLDNVYFCLGKVESEIYYMYAIIVHEYEHTHLSTSLPHSDCATW